jgi:hypothetical protein
MQKYARIAGALFLISAVAGGFGEVFVPSQLVVSGDAAATARNILASSSLFRLGFASYVIEALCDLGLTLLLYCLLRPVSRDFALLAVFFRLVATATFAVTELFYVAPALILGGADYLKSFTTEQLTASRCCRYGSTHTAVDSSWCFTVSHGHPRVSDLSIGLSPQGSGDSPRAQWRRFRGQQLRADPRAGVRIVRLSCADCRRGSRADRVASCERGRPTEVEGESRPSPRMNCALAVIARSIGG